MTQFIFNFPNFEHLTMSKKIDYKNQPVNGISDWESDSSLTVFPKVGPNVPLPAKAPRDQLLESHNKLLEMERVIKETEESLRLGGRGQYGGRFRYGGGQMDILPLDGLDDKPAFKRKDDRNCMNC